MIADDDEDEDEVRIMLLRLLHNTQRNELCTAVLVHDVIESALLERKHLSVCYEPFSCVLLPFMQAVFEIPESASQLQRRLGLYLRDRWRVPGER